jgi:hypothetical protein
MNAHNPFAPSRATLEAGNAAPAELQGSASVWREGRAVVLLPNTELPARCVKCNQPAHAPTQARKVYWYSPWLFLLLLLNVVIFAIVALIVRKTARVAPGLCADHKRRRRNALAVGWVGFVASVVLITASIGSSLGGWGAVLGFFLLLGTLIYGIVKGRIVYPSKIDSSYVRLKGCGEPFLESLPRFPG